ncbi:MAG TPA: 6-pyruvoyl-tetrahydropterin synthase-related protein, partial [Candidatus Polarisedimenticolia bacterium]|nr:6-pyruvoyl-tetrahydropterin synthase-related protein [Candidatus Polarisedimenticolia bacterium]
MPTRPTPRAAPRPPARALPAAIVCAAALAACLPLLIHAPLPAGSDVYANQHYLQAFMKAFSEGDLYPRWTDTTNQGMGGPSFLLFPPLAFYGAGAASWLAGSTIGGLKLYVMAVTLLSGFAFHALARQWAGPGIPAAIAAAVYVLLPYRILDVYQRFALSETTAFVFLPLILLFARRAMLAARPLDVAGLALAYAGLIATHLASTLIVSLFLMVWLVWEARAAWRSLLRPAAALACGAAMAGPVLLPAMIGKRHANISWVREMPNGHYRINFLFKDDVLPGLGFKDPVKPPVLKSAHTQLALAMVAAAMAWAWTAASQRRRRADVAALAAACAAAYLLQVEISDPVWRIIPELATVQFPWRFQTLMVLTAALAAAYALSSGWGRAGGAGAASRPVLGAAGLLLGVVLLANLAASLQNAYLKPFAYTVEINNGAGVRGWVEPALTPRQFSGYRTFKRTPIEMPEASFAEGTGEATVEDWASSRRRLAVQSASGGVVRLRSFWFPGWKATLDGEPLETLAWPPFAALSFRVPPGRHVAEVRFAPAASRRAGAWSA